MAIPEKFKAFIRKKKSITVIVVLGVVIACFLTIRGWSQGGLMKNLAIYQTVKAERGSLTASVHATGNLRSSQSGVVRCQTSGVIDAVSVKVNQFVEKGSVLANLDENSLPPQIILAEVNLVGAKRALEDLQQSSTAAAKAYQAVVDAEQALEDANDNAEEIAKAQANLAAAEKEVRDAETNLTILTTKPSQFVIDQARANMLLAKKRRDDFLENIEHVRSKLNRNPKAYKPWESKTMYKKILNNLERSYPQVQLAYEKSKTRYENLLKPADQTDIAVAQAALQTAQSRLADAKRAYQRVVSGPDKAEIALLEAKLADARREYARVKNGAPQEDIAAAQARIAAAQSTLEMAKITSPFDGTITEIFIHPNDRVEPGTPAFRIDDLSGLQVDMQISEMDINKIQPGQDALLTFDAVFAKEYHGRVTDVAMVGDRQGRTVTYKVTVELIDPDEDVKPGMTANVEIFTKTLDDVLLIPNRAVRISGKDTIVYLLRPDGNLVKTVVKLGASSNTASELLEGDIREGDLIVLNPPATMIFKPRPMSGRPPIHP